MNAVDAVVVVVKILTCTNKISYQQNTIKHENFPTKIYLAKTLASENILPFHYIITNYFINKIKSWVLLFRIIKSMNETRSFTHTHTPKHTV